MKPESSIFIFTKIYNSGSGIGRVQFLDDIMSSKEDPDFGALAGDDITKKCIYIYIAILEPRGLRQTGSSLHLAKVENSTYK